MRTQLHYKQNNLNTCLHQPVTSPYETVPLVLVLSLAWESVFMGYLQGISLVYYRPKSKPPLLQLIPQIIC